MSKVICAVGLIKDCILLSKSSVKSLIKNVKVYRGITTFFTDFSLDLVRNISFVCLMISSKPNSTSSQMN